MIGQSSNLPGHQGNPGHWPFGSYTNIHAKTAANWVEHAQLLWCFSIHSQVRKSTVEPLSTISQDVSRCSGFLRASYLEHVVRTELINITFPLIQGSAHTHTHTFIQKLHTHTFTWHMCACICLWATLASRGGKDIASLVWNEAVGPLAVQKSTCLHRLTMFDLFVIACSRWVWVPGSMHVVAQAGLRWMLVSPNHHSQHLRWQPKDSQLQP